MYPYIVKFLQANGRTPTMREIQDGCGLSSTSVVAWYIDELVERKWLEKDEMSRLTVPGMAVTPMQVVLERLEDVRSERCPICGEVVRLWLPDDVEEVELDDHECVAVPA